jgi:hypothetical protein
MIETALAYLEQGYSIIPVSPSDKKPMWAWKEFQSRHATQAEVMAWFQAMPDMNIGIVTGEVSGISVVDVDGLKGRDSVRALPVVLPATRVIATPNGHHLYYRYTPALTTGANFLPGLDLRSDGGFVVAPPSMIGGKGYSVFRDVGITDIGKAAQHIYRHVKEDRTIKNVSGWAAELMASGSSNGSRNADATRLAGYYRGKDLSDDDIYQMMTVFAQRCTPVMSDRELQGIVKSVGRYPSAAQERASLPVSQDNQDNQPTSLQQQVADWVKDTNGAWFTSRDLDSDLILRTPTEKDNRRHIINRLVKAGEVFPHPTQQGRYRIINPDVKRIDFKHAKRGAVVDIEWPLGVEKLSQMYPHQLAIIAGYSNAGKTAFLYNVIHMNMNKGLPIHLFCSEAPETIADRLALFGDDLEDWNFEAVDRQENYPDVIVPGAINIIDYLSVEDLPSIKGILDRIIAAVGDGIAIVAIQKKGFMELGYGQELTLAPASLYLSMNKGHMKIIKGKHWTNPRRNPDGLELTFAIEDGSKFVPTQFEWEYHVDGK